MKTFLQGLLIIGTMYLIFSPFFMLAAGLLAVFDVPSQVPALTFIIGNLLAWPFVFVLMMWVCRLEETI
jgi:hypothetical protein